MSLLDQQQGVVATDLEVALRLREAKYLGFGLVQPQLRGLERRQQRRVPGENADQT